MGKTIAKVKVTHEKLCALYQLVDELPKLFIPDGFHQELLADHLEELAYTYKQMKAKENNTYIISFTKTQGRAFFQYFTDIGNFSPLPAYIAVFLNEIIKVLDKTFGFAKAQSKLIRDGRG